MGKFLKMTVTKRIQIGFGWTAVLVLMLAATVIAQTVWLQSWRDDYNKSLGKTNVARDIQTSVLRTAIYGLDSDSLETATAAELQSVKDTTEANFTQINGYLDSLELTVDADKVSMVRDMRELVYSCQQGFKAVLDLAFTDIAASRAQMRELRPVLVRLQESVEVFVQSQKAVGDDLVQQLNTTTMTVMVVVGVLAALAVPASLGGAFIITRLIRRQLRAAFTKLSSSAAELMAISTQVAASAAQTAASANEATVTVEEVKQTALLASEKADEVGAEAQDLPQVAEGGRTAAEETAAAFDRVREQMSSVAETISQLSDRTDAVEEIIATVNDLAEQSNLLSVNAEIEAAKAGEYGKGFGVVAQEVKSLADQSKAAVLQARSVLGEIVKAAGLATHAAKEGGETVAAGQRQSTESGEAIFTLAEAASKSAESAIQISASGRQQLAGMEQIGQAMDSINQAGEQSAAGTRQVQDEVMHLQELAVELRELVDGTSWTVDAGATSADAEEAREA